MAESRHCKGERVAVFGTECSHAKSNVAMSPMFMRVRGAPVSMPGGCNGGGTKKVTNYVPSGLRGAERFAILIKSARGIVVVCMREEIESPR
jgi:uncharacterized Fe-S cluster protein YjdI